MDHHLVQLDPDHPGFRDPVYRERRDTIARIAREHVTGADVPDAPYSPEEHGVWRAIRDVLDPLHERHVARDLHALMRRLELPRTTIPQMRDVNDRLARVDFRMEPVAGLVAPRVFLEHLGRGVFLCTQYIRHASKPFYTPEPDVVHELIGHAASLLHPGIRETNRRFGRCAAIATDAEVQRLVQLYWYTLEFGVVREDGELKALGAGLLSSIDELSRALGPDVEHCPFDPDVSADRPYDPTTFQTIYDVGDGLDATLARIDTWLDEGRWRIR
jgi:phenylalanine-4-hydroxylase